jgi:hypothetical protein
MAQMPPALLVEGGARNDLPTSYEGQRIMREKSLGEKNDTQEVVQSTYFDPLSAYIMVGSPSHLSSLTIVSHLRRQTLMTSTLPKRRRPPFVVCLIEFPLPVTSLLSSSLESDSLTTVPPVGHLFALVK